MEEDLLEAIRSSACDTQITNVTCSVPINMHGILLAYAWLYIQSGQPNI